MKKIYLLACTLLLPALAAAGVSARPAARADSVETDAPAARPGSRWLKKFAPTIRFGGYIIGKYSYSTRRNQASDGGFDLRFVRLNMNGYCFTDFYYRLQLEVNGAPGPDKGPRIVDAFIEWQKWPYLRIKLGQFKRPFGFENPYNPLDVGLGSYSQATMKLASIADRNGEHKSSGRDVGIQLQGDLFPSQGDGHPWLHYQVGLFNGQGTGHTDKDHHKDLIGGLWFSPVRELSVGGFGWNGRYVNESYDAANAGTALQSVQRVRWGAGLKLESRWTLRGEYMSSRGGVVADATAPRRSDAWYVTVGVPLASGLKVYGRWDCYRDARSWRSLKTDYDLALNYRLGSHLLFQANYSYIVDRSAPGDGRYNVFDVQVAASF